MTIDHNYKVKNLYRKGMRYWIKPSFPPGIFGAG
jgi:hypothetical protein